MHHLACHHWSKFQTKLTFRGVLAGRKTTQKQPKMTVPASTKAFGNLKVESYSPISIKLARYVCHLNTFHLLKIESVDRRAAEGTFKKTINK